ncbi:MAG: signal recognition particle protein [candidate division NC10 bacterium]|nr:signal recognition particle protein [candidate division NC10 bacterium]
MFEALSDRLGQIFKKLRGHGHLTEKDVAEAIREVRLALLEADVHYRVVKDFVERVKVRAVGKEVLESLTPGQQVVKIVYEGLVELLGGRESRLRFAPSPPSVLMLVGLQGSGKTTTAAKLASRLASEGRHPLLVAADLKRPAAVEQLKVLGGRIGVPVFLDPGGASPLKACREALVQAKTKGQDIVILDTAGRLHIDEPLMEELKAMKEATVPSEILLVVDAMTGQDAVASASRFDGELTLTGVILTKLDGDARGGAALSIRAVTGKPIKFIGVGEKLEALEPFHPDRMASRILGMGDILTLVEKAEAAFDRKKAEELERKIREASFTLEDFREQLHQLRNMGPFEQLLQMIPGLSRVKGLKPDEKEFTRLEAIIDSMTPKERQHPSIIDGSRRRRIALGSGTSVAEVNRLLKQFEELNRLVKQLTKSGKTRRMGRGLPLPGF